METRDADGRPHVRLVPVTADNWRAVDAVQPHPDQEGFVAPVSRYLCLMLFDGVWSCLAVTAEDEVVGHVMRAYDEDEDAAWIGGLVIDAAHQRRGFGRAAVEALLRSFREEGTTQAALSISPENTAARRLYAQLGFVETGETDGDELVARRQLS